MAVDGESRKLPVVLLGADALLAARPSTPVQLAHACLAAGFEAAYPVSWGDELIAADCLGRLASRDRRPLALCACPYAQRACDAEGWPAEALVVASPPVAAARLVRAAYADRAVRITYVGACPSGNDGVIDEQVLPEVFLRRLGDRGIALAEQPESYESVLPPDRRRFLSAPGGAPSAEQLAGEGWIARGLESLRSPSPGTLTDPAPEVGCVCSGAPFGRAAIVALEPPRSNAPVLDPLIEIDLSVDEPEPVIVSSTEPAIAAEPKASARGESVPRSQATAPASQATAPPAQPTDNVGGTVPPLGARRPAMHGPSARRELAWSKPIWPQRLEEVQPRRRFTIVTVLLAAALGLTLPFAVVGGWLLYRGGPGVIQSGRGVAGPTIPAAATVTVSPPADSALRAPTRDSTRDSSPADSTFGALALDSSFADSTADPESPPAGASEVTAAAPAPTGRRDSAAGAVETTPPGRQQSMVGGERSARAATRARSQAATPMTDTAIRNAAVRADIARRRARIDSLSRLVESLTRSVDSLTRPQPQHRPLR